jgi:hypothetical protein
LDYDSAGASESGAEHSENREYIGGRTG